MDETSIPIYLENQGENPEYPPKPAPTGNLVSASLYFRVFLVLGFLIVLIYFTLKFLRRLSLQKPQLSGWGSGIQILSSQVLHGDRMIHVVEVGGECYLLGSSSNGVQLLDHYTEKEVKDRVTLEATPKPETLQGNNTAFDFLHLLRSHLPKKTATPLPHSSKYRKHLRSAAQALKE